VRPSVLDIATLHWPVRADRHESQQFADKTALFNISATHLIYISLHEKQDICTNRTTRSGQGDIATTQLKPEIYTSTPYLTGNTPHLNDKAHRLMPFRKTIAVYCENHAEYINTLCGQNVEFFKRYGTWYI
jgi:hypothetical protein